MRIIDYFFGKYDLMQAMLGPLLLTWVNLNPNMDKWSRAQESDKVTYRWMISHFVTDVITYPCWDWTQCVWAYHHYNEVIMTAMASQITSLAVVYSSVYSGADQRKHQRSASLAFCAGNSPGPVKSPHKGPVTRKMFPFDDVIMTWCSLLGLLCWVPNLSCSQVSATHFKIGHP